MKLLIVFALPSECRPWLRRHGVRCSRRGRGPACELSIGDSLVRIVVSGIGEQSVRTYLPPVLDERPDACIASGLAGGLHRDLRSGQIVVPQRVRSAIARGAIECDRKLVEAAEHSGARAVGSLLSVDRILGRASEKRGWAEVADAADMESYAVLDEAVARGIPAAAIRVIGDAVDRDLPLDFNRLVVAGAVSPWRLVPAIVARPDRALDLVRFSREIDRAASSLANFLEAYVGRLGPPAAPASDSLER